MFLRSIFFYFVELLVLTCILRFNPVCRLHLTKRFFFANLVGRLTFVTLQRLGKSAVNTICWMWITIDDPFIVYSPLTYASQRWYRTNDAGQTISLGNDNAKYLFSSYRRVITILRPTIADAGLYRCESTYHRPSTPPNQDIKISAEARLTVLGLLDMISQLFNEQRVWRFPVYSCTECIAMFDCNI